MICSPIHLYVGARSILDMARMVHDDRRFGSIWRYFSLSFAMASFLISPFKTLAESYKRYRGFSMCGTKGLDDQFTPVLEWTCVMKNGGPLSSRFLMLNTCMAIQYIQRNRATNFPKGSSYAKVNSIGPSKIRMGVQGSLSPPPSQAFEKSSGSCPLRSLPFLIDALISLALLGDQGAPHCEWWLKRRIERSLSMI